MFFKLFSFLKHLKINIDKFEISWYEILKDINFTLNSKDRISIVWPNGGWKTTLLRILTWELKWFSWNIENIWNMSLGYLHQVYSDNEEKLVLDELKDWFWDILEIDKKLKNMEDLWDFNDEYYDLFEVFQNRWGNDMDSKIHGVANGMWILSLLNKKLIEVSWGERTKIALAKVLLEEPDILFLDEPTNFIDMNSVEWLEFYLENKWTGGFVIVSHDREFLDKTCSKTYELQPNREITFYHCSYTDYVLERERVEKRKMNDWERQQDYIKKQENLINRFRAWSRSGWAKSREKHIWKMDRLDKPYIPRKPKFFFEYFWESPEKILSLKEVFIWRKEPLFFIQEAILYSKQRVWIVWENGVWKSTFLKTIIGQIDVLDGYFSKWKSLKSVYYSQMHEELDKNKTIRENFIEHGLFYSEEQLIWLLKHYLFEKEDLDKKVSSLSGWQTSKLLFTIIGQKECNLLILDEPTNHLDYDTRESLEKSLNEFPGTILFISHDRYFVNKLSTHVWFISEWELSICYGNYEDYRFKLEHGIEMDFNLFDEEAELNLVLEEKLWEKEFKRLKHKFKWEKKRSRN